MREKPREPKQKMVPPEGVEDNRGSQLDGLEPIIWFSSTSTGANDMACRSMNGSVGVVITV